MKFHKQKFIVVRNENNEIIQEESCYPTVIACLLDLEPDEVPNFQLLFWSRIGQKESLDRYFSRKYLGGLPKEECEEYKQSNYNHAHGLSNGLWDIVREYWLASKGFKEEWIGDIDQWLRDNPDTPYLCSGKSSRGVDHVVIYMNSQPLHDPHPENSFLTELWQMPYSYLQKI